MKSCKQCGQPMAGDAPEGLCARCLISVAMRDPAPSAADGDATQRPTSAPGALDIPDIGDAAEVARRLPMFEVMEMLGRGGMGVVYKARQRQLDRLVALKILPPVDALTPDFVERFRREARSLAKLSHPNIVAVHDFGESGGLYYFAMEFIDGVNLREMIRTGKMTPAEALAVVPKICDALQFAHEEGVVHRDVKPENILIDKRGRVKIADFGLAKLLRREQSDHTLTMTGMTLGTPRYMAPEQLDKPETVDHRADIYSLGVVFYEMLTGEVPMGRFAPPSEKVRIDVRLDEIVLHALERDADRRYQHASQVRDDVEKVTSQPQVAQASPPVMECMMPSTVEQEAPMPGPSLRALIASGIATILSAILTTLLVTGVFVDRSAFDAFFRQDSVTITLLVMQTLALPCGVLMILAGLNAATSPGFARTAAKLACVPLTPAWLFTLPVGIYVLNKLPKKARVPATASDDPRLSRLALWGVILVASSVLAFAGVVFTGTVVFDHLFTTHYFAPNIPPLGVRIAEWILGTVGVLAGVAGTLCGFAAVSAIRKSDGKLQGLPLAAATAIFLPLLLVGALTFYITNLIAFGIAFNLHTPPVPVPGAPPGLEPFAVIDFAVLDSLVALTVMFFAGRAAWRKISGTAPQSKTPRAPGAWTPLEITAASTTALAFLLGGVNALLGLAQKTSPIGGVTLAALIAAAACVAALLVAQQFRPASTPARAALPELAFPALAACAGPLPWTVFLSPVDGLNFWHGAGFSALNFLVALFLLVTGGAHLAKTRSLMVLLTGFAGLALVLWWNAVPVSPIGSTSGMTIVRKPAYAGVWIAAALAVLTAITGALRLRAALVGKAADSSGI